jgi:hypothetical protein
MDGDDFDIEKEEEMLEAKADERLHAIHNGDEKCGICGKPSYTLLGRLVVCREHARKGKNEKG